MHPRTRGDNPLPLPAAPKTRPKGPRTGTAALPPVRPHGATHEIHGATGPKRTTQPWELAVAVSGHHTGGRARARVRCPPRWYVWDDAALVSFG